jgi:phage terminase large subunit-like protein
LAQSIALLTASKRREILNSLSQEEAESLLYDWEFWARPNQLPPSSNWYIWLLRSGRGFGKTRAGSELIIKWAKDFSPIALVGETKADVRDTMVELGESSILKVSPPWFIPEYEPSKRRLTWPNGSQAVIYSGDEPDQLRGPQHSKAWVDELAKFKYPQETWDNLMFGLRSGNKPQVIVTTTPRPIKIIKNIIADPRAVVTHGHTMDNRDNLAPEFLKYILNKYEGTTLGRQELAGEIMDDVEGALWTRDLIEKNRVTEFPQLIRIAVGVDPPGGATECGILVVGMAIVDGQPHGYVLEDRSLQASPDQWAEAVLTSYNRNAADRVVGEANFGGDMVESTILQAARARNQIIRYKNVHATRGKAVRAEPVVAMYEQGRMHHVGSFPALEDEQCTWVPGDKESPNRMDALVWAWTELFNELQEQVIVYDAGTEVERELEL